MTVSVTLEECWTVALEVYTPRGVLLWMNSRNAQFDNQTPVELIQQGRGQEVLNAINAAADGVFA